jgi:hypothetical protein
MQKLGVVGVMEQQQQSDQPYNEFTPPLQPAVHHNQDPRLSKHKAAKARQRLYLYIGIGIVLVLLLAGGLYWMARDKQTPKTTQTSTNTTTQTQAQTPTPVADSTPVTYKSGTLNMEFTYRKDWTMKESSGGREVTLTSPQTSYTKVDGTATTGVFTLKIRKGVTDAMKATIEKAVAPRNSEVIAYAAPTDQQRYYTNISYAGTKDIFNFFIVTGSTEVKAGGAYTYLLVLNDESYLIVGGYGTDKNGTLGFDSVPKDAIDSSVKDQAVKIVESIKIF